MRELAKGPRDHFDEPALTGPHMTDYRYLAAKLAVVLGDPLPISDRQPASRRDPYRGMSGRSMDGCDA
jgi:hypothetical protein